MASLWLKSGFVITIYFTGLPNRTPTELSLMMQYNLHQNAGQVLIKTILGSAKVEI